MKLVPMLFLAAATAMATNLTFLKVQGTSIVDGTGTRVGFRGIHLTTESWGNWERPVSDGLDSIGEYPFLPQKEIPEHSLEDRDFEHIKELAPFLIRYELSYDLLADDNPLKEKNLTRLVSDVARFNTMGIYVVPVLHYGPGLHLARADYEDKKPGSERIPTIFEDSLTFEQHCQWWELVAKTFRDNPGIAAYQILVEPRVPAEVDGGWKVFRERTIELCRRIRAVDSTHIIVTHHAHSREANPGETYWDPVTGKSVIDTGEQGIIWQSSDNFFTDSVNCFARIPDANLVYSFSVYTPYGFCLEGAEVDYGGEAFTDQYMNEQVEAYMKPRVQFGIDNGVPILVDEYGVNHQKSPEERERWLKIVHSLFDAYHLPSWFYLYKGSVDPYNGEVYNCGLYSYFLPLSDEIVVSDSSYQLLGHTKAAAEKSGFDSTLAHYFWTGDSIRTLSLTDSKPVYDYMKSYLNHETPLAQKNLKTTGNNRVNITGSALHFSHPLNSVHSVALYDLRGRVVWNEQTSPSAISLALPLKARGFYILKVNGPELIQTRTLIL